MNGLRDEALALVRALAANVGASKAGRSGPGGAEVLLCPPATLLFPLAEAVAEGGFALGAQDCHPAEKGAHTGDISAAMLKDAGCAYVILGHSERRRDHGENDAVVRAKMEAARRAGLVPILCVGETEAERDRGATLEIVARQLDGSLPPGLGADRIVVAYEPVWAIGTGRTPTEDDIARVHAHIRAKLAGHVAEAGAVRILYGGSVKADNARGLLRLDNVDGALVGGASLAAAEFGEIVAAADAVA